MPRKKTFDEFSIRTQGVLSAAGYATREAIRSAFLDGRLGKVKNLGSGGLREVSAVLRVNREIAIDQVLYLAASGRQVQVVSKCDGEDVLQKEQQWIVQFTRGADTGKCMTVTSRQLVPSVNG